MNPGDYKPSPIEFAKKRTSNDKIDPVLFALGVSKKLPSIFFRSTLLVGLIC